MVASASSAKHRGPLGVALVEQSTACRCDLVLNVAQIDLG
jgi:hypothetical protein